SLNIPAVKLAEAVGYGEVAKLAKAAGMNMQIRATPAIALGAYEVTPIEVAGSYTVFANKGLYTKPNWVRTVRDDTGGEIFQHKAVRRSVLDPRIAYLMTSLMEEVTRSGTGAGIRSRGFYLPAAGKTGTSHDGWFVGYTTKLICAVWVGFDDNEELKLEGAHSALPVWAAFMKRAHGRRAYRGAGAFPMPDGVVSVQIDPSSGLLSAAGAATARSEVYITGTQPTGVHGGGSATQVASWDAPETPAAPSSGEPRRPRRPVVARQQPPPQDSPKPLSQPVAEEKKGMFGRFGDWFKRNNN
ncbi:MAG: penicillin-binding protein 1A, partial [Acidobacteria bacterium]|nr:penicillin-binding protein 1A [Acidobacteriota bacterium]